MAQLFWRRRFLNFFNVLLLYLYCLPLGKEHLNNLNPFHPWILCAKFGWNWPSGSGEEDENVKSLQTDRRTDRRRTQVIRKAHLSFQLRWAKNVKTIANFEREFVKFWYKCHVVLIIVVYILYISAIYLKNVKVIAI